MTEETNAPLEWTLSQELVESFIAKKEYQIVWDKTTICTITTHCGYEVIWVSHVFDAKHFDKQIWEECAYEDAFNRLVELVGFYIANSDYMNKLEFVWVPSETDTTEYLDSNND